MEAVLARRRTARSWSRPAGVVALGLMASIVLAPVASAQVGIVKDATQTVKDTTQTVKDTTQTVTEPVKDAVKDPGQVIIETGNKAGDAVTDTGNKVGDAVGGPVGGIVKDTTKTVGDAVKETANTTGGVVKSTGEKAGQTYNEVVTELEGITGRAPGQEAVDGTGGGTGTTVKGAFTINEKGATTTSSLSGVRAPFPLTGTEARYIEPVAEVPALESASAFLDVRTPQQFFEAAIEAAKRFAFPLVLTLLVIAFLVIQNKIDKKDPKLAMASLDMDEELLSFS